MVINAQDPKLAEIIKNIDNAFSDPMLIEKCKYPNCFQFASQMHPCKAKKKKRKKRIKIHFDT